MPVPRPMKSNYAFKPALDDEGGDGPALDSLLPPGE